MKYLKSFKSINEDRFLSSNVQEFNVDVNDETIKKFIDKYSTKWILYNKKLGFIWVKDKPKRFTGDLPQKVYHVSPNPNLDKLGIKPCSKLESPFGYYDISFFYLSREDADYGSIPFMLGENYIYEVDTRANVNWLEGFNEPLDGEENLATSDFVDPKWITKIQEKIEC